MDSVNVGYFIIGCLGIWVLVAIKFTLDNIHDTIKSLRRIIYTEIQVNREREYDKSH